MSVAGERPSLLRAGYDLGSDHAKTCFDAEFAKDMEQLVGRFAGWSVIEREQAIAKSQSRLFARNQYETPRHLLALKLVA
jgi:hypothetical protein